MLKSKSLPILAGALGAFIAATPAHASLVVEGITYTLIETTTASPLVDQFDLSITGINGPSDTRGGRAGVNGFSLDEPTNFAGASPPSGFSFELRGFNQSGCNMAGC